MTPVSFVAWARSNVSLTISEVLMQRLVSAQMNTRYNAANTFFLSIAMLHAATELLALSDSLTLFAAISRARFASWCLRMSAFGASAVTNIVPVRSRMTVSREIVNFGFSSPHPTTTSTASIATISFSMSFSFWGCLAPPLADVCNQLYADEHSENAAGNSRARAGENNSTCRGYEMCQPVHNSSFSCLFIPTGRGAALLPADESLLPTDLPERHREGRSRCRGSARTRSVERQISG